MSPSPFDSAPAALASAMDASTTSARIDKFDGSNFHVWKFKMQMVLEDRDLWDVTCGVVKPEHCLTADDQATYKRKARKAFAIICLAMEDSQLPLVRSSLGAFEAWTKLVTHFEKKSLANKLFLRRRLFATVMEDGDDVLEHINKLRTLAEQLDAVGAPVSDEDLVITLLSSLNDSFQFLITALESRSDELTWELVTSRLLHEDLKRKEQHGGVSASDQAFYTNGKRNGHSAKPKGACRHCGKHGHWIAKCPIRLQELGNGDSRRNGHANLARDDSRSNGHDDSDYLFMAHVSAVGTESGSSQESSKIWLIDSGATQHMTHSKSVFSNFRSIKSVKVHLADDGIVEAIGCGDVEMTMNTPCGLRKGVLTNVWFVPKLSRNLFSVARFARDVGPITFDSTKCC